MRKNGGRRGSCRRWKRKQDKRKRQDFVHAPRNFHSIGGNPAMPECPYGVFPEDGSVGLRLLAWSQSPGAPASNRPHKTMRSAPLSKNSTSAKQTPGRYGISSRRRDDFSAQKSAATLPLDPVTRSRSLLPSGDVICKFAVPPGERT